MEANGTLLLYIYEMWTAMLSSRGTVAAVFPFPALTDARKPRWQWGHCVSLEGSKHAEIIYDLHRDEETYRLWGVRSARA